MCLLWPGRLRRTGAGRAFRGRSVLGVPSDYSAQGMEDPFGSAEWTAGRSNRSAARPVRLNT